MANRAQAQYLRIFDEAGTYYRWQQFYFNQSVTWDSQTWDYHPFSVNALVGSATQAEAGISITVPATSLATTVFHTAISENYLCEIKLYEFDSRLSQSATPLTARRRLWRRRRQHWLAALAPGWGPTVRVAIVGFRGTKRPLPGGPGRAPHWRVRPPLDSWSGSCARCLCAIFCLLALRVGLDPLLPCVGGGDCSPITGCKALSFEPCAAG